MTNNTCESQTQIIEVNNRREHKKRQECYSRCKEEKTSQEYLNYLCY